MGISFLTILVFYLPSDSGEKVRTTYSAHEHIHKIFRPIYIMDLLEAFHNRFSICCFYFTLCLGDGERGGGLLRHFSIIYPFHLMVRLEKRRQIRFYFARVSDRVMSRANYRTEHWILHMNLPNVHRFRQINFSSPSILSKHRHTRRFSNF